MRFDIIFLDMRLDKEDGIDVANEIRKTDINTGIITRLRWSNMQYWDIRLMPVIFC